jgi:hypothetical protein
MSKPRQDPSDDEPKGGFIRSEWDQIVVTPGGVMAGVSPIASSHAPEPKRRRDPLRGPNPPTRRPVPPKSIYHGGGEGSDLRS